jgi:endonuclease/exonuclease/phosphatase (EEP) superfamily protein YafD
VFKTVILAGLGFLGLISVMAFFSRALGQPAEMFSHFRVQFVVAGVAAAAVLLVLGDRTYVFAALGLAVLNGAPILMALAKPAPSVADQPGAKTIIWANLQRNHAALEAVAALARQRNADIVALTELPDNNAALVGRAFSDFPCFTAPDGVNVFTTVILCRLPCAPAAYYSEKYHPNTLVAVDCAGLGVVALHPTPAFNAERTAIRDSVIKLGADIATNGAPSVLIGDFNATPWSSILSAVQAAGLRRARCGAPLEATWRSRDPVFGLPLDHLFVSPGLGVVACEIGPDIGSDHWPLIVRVAPS